MQTNIENKFKNKYTNSLTCKQGFDYIKSMNKIESLEKALAQHGLTQFTRLLIKKSGVEFTPQQINNWRTRGVPYRWQDDVKKLIKVDKSALRN